MPLLNINGTDLYVTSKGNGIPLVFIHPPTLTSVTFDYQVEELSKYFQVITFDIRGHGRSVYSSLPITYPLIVEDIKQLLTYFQIEKAFICGYSTGASIVLEFLLTAGERALGGVLISGMSEVSEKDNLLTNKISLGIKLANAGLINVLAWSISLSNSPNQKFFRKMVTTSIKGDARNIKQYYQYSLHYNCTDFLGSIQLPTILIYGKKDKKFHYYAKVIHDKIPSSELQFLENTNHRIPTKAATVFNNLLIQFIHKVT